VSEEREERGQKKPCLFHAVPLTKSERRRQKIQVTRDLQKAENPKKGHHGLGTGCLEVIKTNSEKTGKIIQRGRQPIVSKGKGGGKKEAKTTKLSAQFLKEANTLRPQIRTGNGKEDQNERGGITPIVS